MNNPPRFKRLEEPFTPAALTEGWTPIPHALLTHRKELGLDSGALLLIIAVERERRGPGHIPYITHRKIDEETGLGWRRRDNAIQQLRALDCRIWQPNTAHGYGANCYDLAPLWTRLAALAAREPVPPNDGTAAASVAPNGVAPIPPNGVTGVPPNGGTTKNEHLRTDNKTAAAVGVDDEDLDPEAVAAELGWTVDRVTALLNPKPKDGT